MWTILAMSGCRDEWMACSMSSLVLYWESVVVLCERKGGVRVRVRVRVR